MKNFPRCRRAASAASLAAATLWLILGAQAHAQRPDPRELPPPPPDAEGLERTRNSQVDEFYLRPGASFAGYRRVRIAPVEVSFAKLWARKHRNVDVEESARLRADIGKLAQDELARALARNGGYASSDTPGPDVLDVRATIVNLDIYAPDVKDSAVRRQYVLKAGEATLIAELRDSQTGALLARVIDRREMREYPDFQLANSVYNSAEARDLVGLWARVLRRWLDSAHTDGKGP